MFEADNHSGIIVIRQATHIYALPSTLEVLILKVRSLFSSTALVRCNASVGAWLQ